MNQSSPLAGGGAIVPPTTPPPTLPPVLAGLPREEAIAWLSRLFDAAEAGHQPWSDEETIDRWLAQCSRSGSSETVSAYKREISHLRAWLDRNYPGTPLRLFDPTMAENFVADLRALVADGRMAARSHNRRIAAVSSLFRWASEPGRSAVSGIVRNPIARRVFIAVEKAAKPLMEGQLAELVGTVAAAARQGARTARRDLVMLRLAYLTGLRVSELIGLRWSDVEPVEGGAIVHVRRGKGGRTRAIRVSTATLELVETLGRPADSEAFLFPSSRRDGQPLTRQAAGSRCRFWGAQIGVACWMHRLRHTHASMAVKAGVNTFVLMATMGHRSASTTSGYVRSCPSTSSSLALG